MLHQLVVAAEARFVLAFAGARLKDRVLRIEHHFDLLGLQPRSTSGCHREPCFAVLQDVVVGQGQEVVATVLVPGHRQIR